MGDRDATAPPSGESGAEGGPAAAGDGAGGAARGGGAAAAAEAVGATGAAWVAGAGTLGEMIRRQRELAELPMRRLAEMVGISNPYLSQIERGLRAPSEKVLRAIADNLQLSAEMVAGYTGGRGSAVLAAIERDPDLTDAQRRSLSETYLAYAELTRVRRRRPGAGGAAGGSPQTGGPGAGVPGEAPGDA